MLTRSMPMLPGSCISVMGYKAANRDALVRHNIQRKACMYIMTYSTHRAPPVCYMLTR